MIDARAELITIVSGAADRRDADGQREGVSDGASAFGTEAEVRQNRAP